MIVSRTFTEVSEHELRALLYCAQFALEQLTERPLHKGGPVPRPGESVQVQALKALEKLRREMPPR